MKSWIKQPSRSLHGWRRLLEEWGRVLEEFERAEGRRRPELRDYGYWYGERTNVGFLAAAAWRVKGYALEEYSQEKRRGTRKIPGRADLYLALPPGRKTKPFLVEAAHRWVRMDRPKSFLRGITDAREKLCENLGDYPKELSRGFRKIGVLFVAPWMRKDGRHISGAALRGHFERFAAEASKEFRKTEWDFAARFPSRAFSDTRGHFEQRRLRGYAPGVLLAGFELRKGSR